MAILIAPYVTLLESEKKNLGKIAEVRRMDLGQASLNSFWLICYST